MMVDHRWTDADKAQLRVLWAEGHSASEVGRRMKMTKNMIVGAVRRQGLPHRPSPIRPNGEQGASAKPRLPRVGKTTLAIVHADAAPLAIVPHVTNGRVKHTLPAVEQGAATVFKPRASTACCYPIGEPRTASFRFCNEPTLPGKPYCPGCHARCYVRIQHPTVHDAA